VIQIQLYHHIVFKAFRMLWNIFESARYFIYYFYSSYFVKSYFLIQFFPTNLINALFITEVLQFHLFFDLTKSFFLTNVFQFTNSNFKFPLNDFIWLFLIFSILEAN